MGLRNYFKKEASYNLSPSLFPSFEKKLVEDFTDQLVFRNGMSLVTKYKLASIKKYKGFILNSSEKKIALGKIDVIDVPYTTDFFLLKKTQLSSSKEDVSCVFYTALFSYIDFLWEAFSCLIHFYSQRHFSKKRFIDLPVVRLQLSQGVSELEVIRCANRKDLTQRQDIDFILRDIDKPNGLLGKLGGGRSFLFDGFIQQTLLFDLVCDIYSHVYVGNRVSYA